MLDSVLGDDVLDLSEKKTKNWLIEGAWNKYYLFQFSVKFDFKKGVALDRPNSPKQKSKLQISTAVHTDHTLAPNYERPICECNKLSHLVVGSHKVLDCLPVHSRDLLDVRGLLLIKRTHNSITMLRGRH